MQLEKDSADSDERERIDAEIDELIFDAYGFSAEQKAYLRQWNN
jgi:hypothetical protein